MATIRYMHTCYADESIVNGEYVYNDCKAVPIDCYDDGDRRVMVKPSDAEDYEHGGFYTRWAKGIWFGWTGPDTANHEDRHEQFFAGTEAKMRSAFRAAFNHGLHADGYCQCQDCEHKAKMRRIRERTTRGA